MLHIDKNKTYYFSIYTEGEFGRDRFDFELDRLHIPSLSKINVYGFNNEKIDIPVKFVGVINNTIYVGFKGEDILKHEIFEYVREYDIMNLHGTYNLMTNNMYNLNGIGISSYGMHNSVKFLSYDELNERKNTK